MRPEVPPPEFSPLVLVRAVLCEAVREIAMFFLGAVLAFAVVAYILLPRSPSP